MAQHGIITQQVMSSMLRCGTVAGVSPIAGGVPLEGIMLQGTYALIACSAVHRVRTGSKMPLAGFLLLSEAI